MELGTAFRCLYSVYVLVDEVNLSSCVLVLELPISFVLGGCGKRFFAMLLRHTDEFKVASLVRCWCSALRLLRPLLLSVIFLCLLFVLVDLLLRLFV